MNNISIVNTYILFMSALQRRPIKCSLCEKTGHNIRSCSLFDTAKRDVLFHYMTWLHQSITGFSNRWIDFTEEISPENLELLRNAASITVILKTPLPCLNNIDDLSLKSLIYGFKMNNTGTRQKKIELLHYIFIGEADKAWLKSNNIPKVVPYLINSSNHIVELEYANAQLFNFSDLLTDDFQYLITHDDFFRQEKIRTLYNANFHQVRFFNKDIHRYDRHIRDTKRQMLRLQGDLHRLEHNKEEINRKRTITMIDLTLFPPNLSRPQIEFMEKTITHSIECAICYENIKAKNVTSLNCEHSFCIHCTLNTVLTQYNSKDHKLECKCPICREKIKTIFGNSEKLKDRLQHQIHSSKINADISDLIG